MRTTVLGESRRRGWDALVAAEESFSLTQSWDWGVFKSKLGWQAYRVAVEDAGVLVAGAQLLIKPLLAGLAMAYVPRGPVGRWTDDEAASLLLPELDRIAREHNAILLKIEPPIPSGPQLTDVLVRFRYRQSRITNQPQTTVLLDITGSPDEILMQMKKKTRQYIRRAEREGISTRLGDLRDLPAFCEMMRLTGERAGFSPRSLDYHQAQWETFASTDQLGVLLAYHQGELVAVRTVFAFGPYAAEFHGGSITTPGLHPNHLLVWRAIQWARERGCRRYDMWGVPDDVEPVSGDEKVDTEVHDDGLWGVYRFKRGFGPTIVRYAGAYDRVYAPGLRLLFESAMLSRSRWERAAAWFDVAVRSSR